jgi:ketosteroid isomerase-like protein
MKKLSFLVILGVILTASTSALADDVADIKSAMKKHFVTMNAGDSAGHIAHHKAGNSSFGAEGGALTVNKSLDEETVDMQANFDEGYKFDFKLEDVDVAVYGDTAVVTSLQTGTVTAPDGKTEKVKNRRTAIVVRDGSDWKEVHSHISAYVEEPTE